MSPAADRITGACHPVTSAYSQEAIAVAVRASICGTKQTQQEHEECRQRRHLRAGDYQGVKGSGVTEIVRPDCFPSLDVSPIRSASIMPVS